MSDTPADERLTVMTVSRIEAATLADLVSQFAMLVADAASDPARDSDPAVERLTPSAYPDDAEAHEDFRRATQQDVLERRHADARTMLDSLPEAPADLDDTQAQEMIDVVLDDRGSWAWMRTLTALRLVIAERLGIDGEEDDHDPADDRFAVYDWLGYRLDGLVASASAS